MLSKEVVHVKTLLLGFRFENFEIVDLICSTGKVRVRIRQWRFDTIDRNICGCVRAFYLLSRSVNHHLELGTNLD